MIVGRERAERAREYREKMSRELQEFLEGKGYKVEEGRNNLIAVVPHTGGLFRETDMSDEALFMEISFRVGGLKFYVGYLETEIAANKLMKMREKAYARHLARKAEKEKQS